MRVERELSQIAYGCRSSAEGAHSGPDIQGEPNRWHRLAGKT